MSYPGRRQTERFVTTVALPALQEVHEELRAQGAEVTLSEGVVEGLQIPHLDLLVTMGDERGFKYQIYPVQLDIPTYAVRSTSEQSKYYRMEVFSLEGSHGYDLMGYSKEQVITDVLDHYETHLDFLHLNRSEPGNTALPKDQTAKANWEADYDSEDVKK
jgi:choline/glycine/proline betaine transport protein